MGQVLVKLCIQITVGMGQFTRINVKMKAVGKLTYENMTEGLIITGFHECTNPLCGCPQQVFRSIYKVW